MVDRLTSRTALTRLGLVLAWTGIALSVLAPVLATLPVDPALRFLAVLAFACFGPGAAVLCHVRLGDAASTWGMSLVLSLSLFALVAVGMVWTGLWHPLAGLIGLALLTAAACLVALLAGRRVSGIPVADRPTALPEIGGHANADATSVLQTADTTVVISNVRPAGTTLDDAPKPVQIDEHANPEATLMLPAVQVGRAADVTQVVTAGMETPAGDEHPGADSTQVIPTIGTIGTAMTSDASGGRVALSLLDVILLVVPVGLWLASISATDTTKVDNYGLLFVMDPAFFVAIALCVFGFFRELTRDNRRGWMLTAQVVLLVLLMHATVPLLVREPEYAWVYTHLGVVDFIRTYGEVKNSLDIYQQWPTFFSAVAQLLDVSGMDPLRVAAWAPPFFDLANCLLVYAIARTLSNDARVPYLTVFLFTSINWIGQDYLAPQAFAFLLSMGVLLIMLRWLRRTPSPRARRQSRLTRIQSWVQKGLADVPYTSAWTRRTALTALYLVYTVIVISHQISPYIVAASAIGLVVLGLIQPWRIVPILLGIAIIYVVPRHSVLESYGIFNGINFLKNAQGNHAGAADPGQVFSRQVVQSLALGVWGMTALIVLAARRRLGPVALPAVLAFAPIAILFGQSYGGEAIYRVFLFSAPWCAYLMATTAVRAPVRAAPVRARALRLAIAIPITIAMALASMQGEHGQLAFSQFPPDEVRSAIYVSRHVEHGAWVVNAQPNVPDRLTARYSEINSGRGGTPVLLQNAYPGAVTVSPAMDERDLGAIDSYFDGFRGAPAYLVISSSMEEFADYFGYLPPGTLDRLTSRLDSSPRWTLWHSSEHMRVYRFVPR